MIGPKIRIVVVTKAEVLIIVDQPNGQRFVCGSNVILDKYNKGTLTPTEKDRRYDESAVKSPGSTDVPGVEPLDVTPYKIDIDERLASVLVHERANIASAAEPDSRKQLSFGPSEAVLPTPVRELLLDRPTPQLSDQERDEVPPVQRQSKIMFISDIDVELFVGQEETEQEPHENTVFVLDP